MREIIIEYTPAYRPPQRVRYEPHDEGAGYWRIREEWDGQHWYVERRESITDIVCELDSKATGREWR